MSNKSQIKKIIFVLLVLVVVMNAISFFFLPDRISLQINTSWDVHGSTLPKALYVLMGPLVLTGAYLFASRSPESEKQGLLLGAIAFVGSIATIIFNMIAQ